MKTQAARMLNSGLWQQLEHFEFDDPQAVTPFSKKLEEGQDWRETHTRKVIREYRKFLYLSQVVPGGVAPSEDVDKAWHLHLTHTRNYWEHLCGQVLGKPLHHDPSRGPRDAAQLMARYACTLEVYRQEFGRPPASVWPSVARIRARAAGRKMTGLGMVLFGTGLFALFLGSGQFLGHDLGWLPWSMAAVGLSVSLAGMWFTGAIHPKRKSDSASGGCGPSCGGD